MSADPQGEGSTIRSRYAPSVELVTKLLALISAQEQALAAERTGRTQDQALLRSGQVLTATLQLQEVLAVILHELRQVVPYDTASVQEHRDSQMVIVGGVGIDLEVFADVGFDVPSGGNPNSEVLRRGEPVIVPDILADHPYSNFPHPAHEMSGVRSWLGVPLMFGDECIGMLTLDAYEPHFYTPDHVRIAKRFAAQAAIAMNNARLFERSQREVEERRRAEEELRAANQALEQRMAEIQALQADLRQQAIRDPLTQLFNRRYLMETLPREVARARRESEPVAVAVIDVDHFKVVNDTFGHETGDQLLVEIAQLLLSLIREDDVVCRYGGEEFVVVLPGTPWTVARERAEGWRRAVKALTPPAGMTGPSVTISVGLAEGPTHALTGTQLISAADAAMYVAKRNGRDQVMVAEAAAAPLSPRA